MRRWLRITGLITIGLVMGLGLGLYLGWVAWPTEFTDADPTVLQDVYRQDYALMIATAYAADGDLASAKQRVASLGADGRDFLLALVLDLILQGRDDAETRRLARLAADLDLYSPAMAPYLAPATEPVNEE